MAFHRSVRLGQLRLSVERWICTSVILAHLAEFLAETASRPICGRGSGLEDAACAATVAVACEDRREDSVRWLVDSNARTREKAKEISKSRIPNFPNFLGLVLGCIEAKLCK